MEENIMEMIQPKVDLIEERDPYKKIELVGRTCYKSEDKITQDSSKKFVQGLIKRTHTAMLEHATVVFQLDPVYELYAATLRKCKYLNVTCTKVPRQDGKKRPRILVSGNIRAINESDVFILLQTMYENSVYRDLVYNKQFIDTYADQVEGQTSFYSAKIVDIKSLDNLSEEEILNHCYMTLRFTCDRGVSHEIVRHREDEENGHLPVPEQFECAQAESVHKGLSLSFSLLDFRKSEAVEHEHEAYDTGNDELMIGELEGCTRRSLAEIHYPHTCDETHGAENPDWREVLHGVVTILLQDAVSC